MASFLGKGADPPLSTKAIHAGKREAEEGCAIAFVAAGATEGNAEDAEDAAEFDGP
jgi:hypothetical protein